MTSYDYRYRTDIPDPVSRPRRGIPHPATGDEGDVITLEGGEYVLAPGGGVSDSVLIDSEHDAGDQEFIVRIRPADWEALLLNANDGVFAVLSSGGVRATLVGDEAFSISEADGSGGGGPILSIQGYTGAVIGAVTFGSDTELGFFGSGSSGQPAAIADATDAASTMARLNDLLAALRTLGLIAT